ncbi:hypothetical protein CU669_18565, partial [Paramagnetospirillum kuznetsovii]
MADTNNPNQPTDHNTGTGDGAHQALDDLTVLQNVQDQSLGDARLNLSRPVDVSDTSLGNLANVQQGSTSNPQVHDIGAIAGGVNVALDVAIEGAEGSTVAPPDLGSAPAQFEDQAVTVEVKAEGAKALNVQSFDNLAQPDENFKPQELPEGRPTDLASPTGPAVTNQQQAAADAPAETVVPDQQEKTNSAPDAPNVTIDTGSVEDPNTAPVVGGADIYSKEDTPRTFKFGVSATDADGDTLTFTVTNPSHGSISKDPATGEYTYNLEEDWNGVDSFTVTVDDGNGHAVSKTFSVNIEGVADGASISSVDSVLIQEGGNFGLNLNVTDTHYNEAVTGVTLSGAPAGSTLTIGGEEVAANADGTFSLTPAQANAADLSIKPPSDFYGTINLEVSAAAVDHGAALAEDATATTSKTIVIEVNAPPTIDNSDASDHGSVTGHISASDPDNANLSYTLVGGVDGTLAVDGGSVTMDAQGNYTFTPEAGWQGGDTASFDVQVSDGRGGTATRTVTVTETNEGPVVESEVTEVTQAGTVKGGIDATDADNDHMTYHLVDPNGNVVDSITNDSGTITINSETGDYTFVASDATKALAAGESVNDSFDVRVSDGHGGVGTTSIDVTIDGANDAAVITGDAKHVSEDSASVSGHVSVTDADHDQAVMQETTQETPEGTFTMGTDGNWSFAVNSGAVQGMAAGESLTKDFKI